MRSLLNFFPEIVRPKAANVGPQIGSTFGKAYKRGVKIAFGTDAGVQAHGTNWKEFVVYHFNYIRFNAVFLFEGIYFCTLKTWFPLRCSC
mgnify:CR=1 FL=1